MAPDVPETTDVSPTDEVLDGDLDLDVVVTVPPPRDHDPASWIAII